MNAPALFSRLGLQALLPVVAVAIGLGFYWADPAPVQSLRNAIFDQYQQLSPRVYQDAPVRVADIDDASLARLGQWPWPRTQLAVLVDRLRENGAAAVVFDVTFPEPDRTSPRSMRQVWQRSPGLDAELNRLPDHDAVFARTLARGRVVLGFALADAATVPLSASPYTVSEEGGSPLGFLYYSKGSVASLPVLQQAAAGNGAFIFKPDHDGIVRRIPLFLNLDGKPVPSLTSEAMRVAQGLNSYEISTLDTGGGGVQSVKIGDFSIPTNPQGEMWLHYTEKVPQRTLPVWKILAGEIPRDQIEDRIILVGTSAEGLKDLRFSPMGGSFPGVEAHAQALEQIIGGDFLRRPDWATGLEVVALVAGGLAIGAIALHTPALVAALSVLLMLGAMTWGGWHLFSAKQLLVDTTVPGATVLLSFLLTSVYRHVAAELRQRWVKQAFSRYVSPNLVNFLVEHPDNLQLGGRRQECSFIFTDLAGFTNLMEKIDPTAAVGLLNKYLDEMIAIAFKHEGTLDRIVGDAVAVIFSAPVEQADHRARAYRCARDMQAFSNRYMAEANARGIAFGMTRIGVHTGEVTVGNFGGSTIFDYRALGDPINTAARLESVNKQLGTQMCVSEATLSGCADAIVRPVGKLVLKGKSLPLMVYQPVDETDPEYAAAYQLLAEEKPEAHAVFMALAKQRPDDPLPRFHLARLDQGQQGEVIVFDKK